MRKPVWAVAHMLRRCAVPCAEQLAAMLAKQTADAPAAARYLYGTPSESGNIALRVGDAVTRYDGVVIETLPEYDAETYPLMLMRVVLSEGYMHGRVYLSANKIAPTYTANSDGSEILSVSSDRREWYTGNNGAKWYTVDTSNAYTVNIKGANGRRYCDVLWTNYDLENTSGGIYHAASDPIAVGEIADYDGDIPIYEVI